MCRNFMQKNSWNIAMMNAIGTAAYITVIALFLSNTSKLLGGEKETYIIPIAMLLLFVTSASITGALVLGRPLLWYLDGKKKEAVRLFIQTVVVLLALVVFIFFILAISK